MRLGRYEWVILRVGATLYKLTSEVISATRRFCLTIQSSPFLAFQKQQGGAGDIEKAGPYF